MRHRDGRWVAMEVLFNNFVATPGVHGSLTIAREATGRHTLDHALMALARDTGSDEPLRRLLDFLEIKVSGTDAGLYWPDGDDQWTAADIAPRAADLRRSVGGSAQTAGARRRPRSASAARRPRRPRAGRRRGRGRLRRLLERADPGAAPPPLRRQLGAPARPGPRSARRARSVVSEPPRAVDRPPGDDRAGRGARLPLPVTAGGRPGAGGPTGDGARAEPALQELDALKTDLVLSVSHELRTPLTSIISFAGLLDEDPATRSSADGAQYASVIKRNAERLLRMVGDLLFLGRLEAGISPLTIGPVDLPAAVDAAVEEARPAAGAKGVVIQSETGRGRPFSGDPERVRQLVDNLLSNAVKYSETGGSVRVSAQPDPEGWRLVVADDGIGIPRNEVRQVFERFYAARKLGKPRSPDPASGSSSPRRSRRSTTGRSSCRPKKVAGRRSSSSSAAPDGRHLRTYRRLRTAFLSTSSYASRPSR